MRSSASLLLVSLVSLILAGCGSSPPVRYYGLGADHRTAIDPRPGAAVLLLGPLRFPEYLERNQIVMRGSGNEVLVDDFARWVEPLDQAMPRAIAADVDGRLDDVVVVAFPSSNLANVDYRLVGTVNRFDVDQAEQAILNVQWGVTTIDGAVLVEPRRSNYVATARSPSTGDLVAAMSDTIAQFGREIAAEIEASSR